VAKAWGGRFQGDTDPRVENFTESISFDARLAAYDIQGSQAHARMLATAGLITDDESRQIIAALPRQNLITRGNSPRLVDAGMAIRSHVAIDARKCTGPFYTGRKRR
jgi:argininosuccinate lyase